MPMNHIPMNNIQAEFSRLIENSSTKDSKRLRKLLFDAFTQGMKAVMPEQIIENSVHVNGTQLTISNNLSSQHVQYNLLEFSKVLIIGGGKATAGLTGAVIKKIGEIVKCYGSINVPKGQESQWGDSINFTSTSGIESKIAVVYASHPIPDNNGIKGTQKIIELVSQASRDTLVLVIISGGGSALMPLPKSPITLSALQALNDVLLKCGASIVEINAIRKHVSDFKGGQLAEVIYPRTGLSLILSDVRGDPIDSIASGPTSYDSSTYAKAWEIIEKYRIVHIVPESIRVILRKGVNGMLKETPKQDHPVFIKMTNFIIGSAATAVSEIKNTIQRAVKEITIFPLPELFGIASSVGKKLAADFVSKEFNGRKGLFITSGETTVSVKEEGIGGRNQEMLLAMLQELNSHSKLNMKYAILSIAFDGIEGNSPAAGAIIDSDSLVKVKEKKLNVEKYLSENDSYTFFKEMGDAVEIGQTGTNVNDILCILVEPTK